VEVASRGGRVPGIRSYRRLPISPKTEDGRLKGGRRIEKNGALPLGSKIKGPDSGFIRQEPFWKGDEHFSTTGEGP